MPQKAAHGHNLALVMKGMGQHMMQNQRRRPVRHLAAGKTQLSIAVELLLGQAGQIIERLRSRLALQGSRFGKARPSRRIPVSRRNSLQPPHPSRFTPQQVNHLIPNGGIAKAGQFPRILVRGKRSQVVEEQTEARMGPRMKFLYAVKGEHNFHRIPFPTPLDWIGYGKEDKGLESLKRSLTDHEKLLIRWLIEHGNPGSDQFLPQIDRLTVVGICKCGCPTVDFALDGDPVSQKGAKLISDHLAESDGESVGVMLFQTDGKISSLEVYSLAGSDQPFGLPPIESLHAY